MVREFAGELGGRSEDYGSDRGVVDYDSWPFAQQLTAEKQQPKAAYEKDGLPTPETPTLEATKLR